MFYYYNIYSTLRVNGMRRLHISSLIDDFCFLESFPMYYIDSLFVVVFILITRKMDCCDQSIDFTLYR